MPPRNVANPVANTDGTTNAFNIWIDKVAPVCTASYSGPKLVRNAPNTGVTVNHTASDALSGLASDSLLSITAGFAIQPGDVANWTFGPGAPNADTSGDLYGRAGNGTYTIKYRATDVAGNTADCSALVKIS